MAGNSMVYRGVWIFSRAMCHSYHRRGAIASCISPALKRFTGTVEVTSYADNFQWLQFIYIYTPVTMMMINKTITRLPNSSLKSTLLHPCSVYIIQPGSSRIFGTSSVQANRGISP